MDMSIFEKFESLKRINDDCITTCEDGGYIPCLYHYNGNWHVTWIHYIDKDILFDYCGETIEQAIDKAYDMFHSKFCNG